MTRIDFYVLPTSDPEARFALVCRLAEKAVGVGRSVFVHADERAPLVDLDERLWTFRASSFVPHRLLDDDGAAPGRVDDDPVQLSCGAPAPDRRVLINLAAAVPPFFARFERALEIVDQSEPVRAQGRERYRFYRHRGYPLKHHDVS